MMKFAATALAAVLLQASPTFAGGLGNALKDVPLVKVMESSDDDSVPTMRPSLNSHEIAAIQYHDTLSSRCQTREGTFAVTPLQPINTACVAKGLPGFMSQ
jgi:hypothetical protein